MHIMSRQDRPTAAGRQTIGPATQSEDPGGAAITGQRKMSGTLILIWPHSVMAIVRRGQYRCGPINS